MFSGGPSTIPTLGTHSQTGSAVTHGVLRHDTVPSSEQTHRAGERRWPKGQHSCLRAETQGTSTRGPGGGRELESGKARWHLSVCGHGLIARDRGCWKWSKTAGGLRMFGTLFHF